MIHKAIHFIPTETGRAIFGLRDFFALPVLALRIFLALRADLRVRPVQ